MNITHLRILPVIISFETRLNIFLKDIFAGKQDILIKNFWYAIYFYTINKYFAGQCKNLHPEAKPVLQFSSLAAFYCSENDI